MQVKQKITASILTRKVRKVIRRSLGSKEQAPISVVHGIAMAPRLVGHGYYYTTRTGIPINSPSAYSRRGWSSMVYHNSTRRIEVGEDWIVIACANLPSIRAIKSSRQEAVCKS